MSIRSSILGVLTLTPTYGHQILFEIERRLPHRRGVNPGQVYSTLSRLVGSGHLTSGDVTPGNLPIYRLTDKGRREADSWLRGHTVDVTDWNEVRDVVLLSTSLPDVSPDTLFESLNRVCVSGDIVSGDRDSDERSLLSVEATRIHLRAVTEWLDVVKVNIARGKLTAMPLAEDRPGRGRRPKSTSTTEVMSSTGAVPATSAAADPHD